MHNRPVGLGHTASKSGKATFNVNSNQRLHTRTKLDDLRSPAHLDIKGVEMEEAYPDDITKDYNFEPGLLQRVNFRATKPPIVIVDPDPSWPQAFESLKARIVGALGEKALIVSHVGSTSIPFLPAKPVIDIDLIVPDAADEASYVPALQSAGFLFLTREPHWYEHRLFTMTEPHCNLHVFAKGSAEPLRHLVFKEWLLANEDERLFYVTAKREAAAASLRAGTDMMDYNARKQDAIRQILRRAFRARGLLD